MKNSRVLPNRRWHHRVIEVTITLDHPAESEIVLKALPSRTTEIEAQ